MRNSPPQIASSSEPSSSMRAGAPELDSREATFEAQQEQEALAAAAAAQRRGDRQQAESAELKDPPPELGASEISARAAGRSDRDDPDPPLPRPDGRRAMRTVETQSDDKAGDWQSFDLGKALRLLHSGDDSVIRRTLRRLHVRFWHAASKRMIELLTRAGAPAAAIKLLPEIF